MLQSFLATVWPFHRLFCSWRQHLLPPAPSPPPAPDWCKSRTASRSWPLWAPTGTDGLSATSTEITDFKSHTRTPLCVFPGMNTAYLHLHYGSTLNPECQQFKPTDEYTSTLYLRHVEWEHPNQLTLNGGDFRKLLSAAFSSLKMLNERGFGRCQEGKRKKVKNRSDYFSCPWNSFLEAMIHQ